MADEVSEDESRKILAVASDVRPDENVHDDPALAAQGAAKGRPVTAEESARIMRLATDVRPLENVHREQDGTQAD